MIRTTLSLLGLLALAAPGPALGQTRPSPAAPPPTAPAAAADQNGPASPLRVEPAAPAAGQALGLHYQPAGTALAGKAGVRAVVYAFDLDHLRWVAADLPLQPAAGGELTATFTPPAYTGFVAFKFVAADGTTDTHPNAGLASGYPLMLRSPSRPGQLAPGAYLGYGLLRAPGFGYGVPDYFKEFTISDEALYHWFREEFHYYPASAPGLMPQYLKAAQPLQGSAFAAGGAGVLRQASRQPNLTETDLLGIEQAYRHQLGNASAADSVAQVLNTRFPGGYLVRRAQLQQLSSSRDNAERRQRELAFLQAYPPAAAYLPPARYAIEYDRVYLGLILGSLATKNYDALLRYAPSLSYRGLLTIYQRGIMNSLRPGMLSAAEALPYSAQVLGLLDARREERPAEFSYLSPQEWRQYADQTSNFARIRHAELLVELGKYAEARPVLAQAQQVAQYQSSPLNEAQAAVLHQGGAADHAQLLAVLRASVNRNQASPQLLAWLREDYLASHPTGTGYDQYLTSLQDQGALRKDRAAVAAQLRNQPIAPFSLLDLNGQRVSLAALKGKVVVLDFWATWCGPCKASFPGMKLAQEHFKDDPNVVFYFIDTEETKPNYKQLVQQYLTANSFPFQVLFDEKAPGGKTMDKVFSGYAKAFQVSGIPQKFIIDSQGRLRFISAGYQGSPSGLADEIVTMVELARKAQ